MKRHGSKLDLVFALLIRLAQKRPDFFTRRAPDLNLGMKLGNLFTGHQSARIHPDFLRSAEGWRSVGRKSVPPACALPGVQPGVMVCIPSAAGSDQPRPKVPNCLALRPKRHGHSELKSCFSADQSLFSAPTGHTLWAMSRLIAFLILVLAHGGLAQAALANPPRRLRGAIITDLGSNLYARGTAESAINSSLVAIANYSLSHQWILRGQASAAKDYTGFREWTWFDPTLALLHQPLTLVGGVGRWLRLMPGVTFTLPATSRSRSRESLITAARVNTRWVADFSSLPALSGLSLSYDLSGTRAFHTYETATTGSVNTVYRLTHWLNAGWWLTSRWSISVDFIRGTSWSYQGGSRNTFSLGETLAYGWPSGLMLSVGHSNEGDILRADGISTNLAVVDSEGSRIFVGLTVPF